MKPRRKADGRDRTGDIRFTRAVLYQLSYVGVRPHRIAAEPGISGVRVASARG